MSGLLTKFKLGPHYKIERFGVLFIVLVICISIVTGSILVKAHKEDNQQLSSRAMYSTSFVMSKTGTKGSVDGIYSNSSHTKIFIMLKFDDVSKISTSAADYRMFLTGSSLNQRPTHLNINPSGIIYMFGTTGYMGLYLTEAGGFESQILDLTLRCKKDIVNSTGEANDDEDESFAKFDQCRIYFNAGGASAPVAEFLDTEGSFDIKAIYEELISRPQEEDIRTALAGELKTMKSDMDMIAEYTRRVQDDGIVLNDPPEAIAGDVIRDAEGNIVSSFDPSSEQKNVSDDTVLYLDTDYTAVRGINYDWQDKYIRDGYLQDMIGTQTPVEFISSIISNESSASDSFNTGSLVWYRTNGAKFEPNSVSQLDVNTNKDISNLISAWNTYWGHKRTYQTGNLIDLLELEAEVLSSDSNFTINDDEDVLINWQSD